MIREPPGLPVTIASLPSLATIVGAIEESGRFPGAIVVDASLDEPVHVCGCRASR